MSYDRIVWIRALVFCVGVACLALNCSDEAGQQHADDATGDTPADAGRDVVSDTPGDPATDAAGDPATDAAGDPATDAVAGDVGDLRSDGSDASDGGQDHGLTDLGDDTPGDDAAPDSHDGGDSGDAADLLADAPDLTDTLPDGDLGASEVPLAGFGMLTGTCGFLDDEEWNAEPAESYLFVNQLDFGSDAYDEADYDLLSEGGRAMIDAGGLNEGSLLSEVFAYEVLYRCELAALLETEGTIMYEDANGPKTDFLSSIDARQIGVSVVRAHPLDNPFDLERAQELLEDKLQGIIDSTDNVTGEDVWERQILSVIAADASRVSLLEQAYDLISDDLLIDTIIVITRTDGTDDPLYCQDGPCGG